MKSQTSLVAQQTRLNQWTEQIRECNNRPQGMTVDDWCFQNGIKRTNYYWRLRKVREALLTAAETTTNATFVELKEPEVNPIPVKKALNLMGFEVGPMRMPLTEMEEDHAKVLLNELKKVGIVK